MTTQLVQPTVKGKLRRLQGALRARLAGEGAAWILLAMVAGVLATLALDWLLRFPVAIRIGLDLVVLAGLGYVAFRYLLRPLMFPMDSDNLALLVERRHGQLGDRLISALQFERDDNTARLNVSEAMIERLALEANKVADGINFNDVVERRGAKRMLSAACCALVLLAGFSVWQQELMGIWVKRNVMFQNVPWPQDTYLEVAGADENGNFYALRGDDLPVLVYARHGFEAPAEILFHPKFRDTGDAMIKAPRLDDPGYFFPVACDTCGKTKMVTIKECNQVLPCDKVEDALPCGGQVRVPSGVYINRFPVQDTFEFYVTGGDDTLDKDHPHQVLAIDPPKVSTARFTIEFEAYMNERERTVAASSGVIPARVGARIIIEAETNKDIDANGARVQIDDGPMVQMQVLPMQVDGQDMPRKLQGKIALSSENVRSHKTLKIHLTDSDGHRNPRPNSYLIQCDEDRAPDVKFKVRSIGTRVSSRVSLPLVITASDDCGLTRLECLRSAAGSGENPTTKPAFAPVEVANKLSGREYSNTWRLDCESMKLVPGDTLTVGLRGYDNMPAEMKGPNVGNSGTISYTVATDPELREEINGRLLSIRGDFDPTRLESANALGKTAAAKAALKGEVTPEVRQHVADSGRCIATIAATCSKTLLAATAVHEELENNRLLPEDKKQDALGEALPKLETLQDDLLPKLRAEIDQAGSTTDAKTLNESLASIAEKQVQVKKELEVIYDLIGRGIDINMIAAQLERLVEILKKSEEILRKKADSETGIESPTQPASMESGIN